MMNNKTTKENIMDFSPYFESNNGDSFQKYIGGTTYLVKTFWNDKGTQTLLQQFMELIKSEYKSYSA